MPIDFEAIVATIEVPLKAQTKRLTPLFAVLATRFGKWQKQVAAADTATRDIPIVTFHFGGVSMLFVGSPRQPQGIGQDLERAGQAFVDGLSFVPTSVTQELLLLRFVEAGATVTSRLAQRTEQILALDPDMFSTADSSFFDIPALAALGARVLNDAGFLDPGSGGGPAGLGDGAAGDAATGGPATGIAGASTPTELIDMVIDYALGVVLVLPGMTVVLSAHATAASAVAKIMVLQQLHAVEQALLTYRAMTLEKLLEFLDTARIVRVWIEPLLASVVLDVAVMATWLPNLINRYLTTAVEVVEKVDRVARILVPLLEFVWDVLKFLQDFDLLWMIPGIRLTIGDVVLGRSMLAAGAVGANLIALAGNYVLPISGRDRRIYFHLGRMFMILSTHVQPALPRGPVIDLEPIPDFGAMVLTDDLRDAVTNAIWAVGPRVGRDVAATLNATGQAARGLGRVAEQFSQRALQGMDGLEAGVREAIVLGDRIMSDERDRVEAQLGDGTAVDPSVAFFATAAFGLSRLLPHYVMSFQRILAMRRFEPRDPSPHILAKRARLVGVHTERLTVRVGSSPSADGSAEAVSAAMRSEISSIYQRGLGELDRAATPAGSR